MGTHCCGGDHRFDGTDPIFKRILLIVMAINIIMFVVEMTMGYLAGSQALMADALDFAADGITYAISFWVIGKSIRIRAGAALGKGFSLLAMGLWVAGSTIYQVFVLNVPTAEIMGGVALAAFSANAISVLLLAKWRDGDANIRSVWLCSRNDAIGNLIVLIAAFGVWGTNTAWPDLIVAGIMAALFLSSAWQIVRQGMAEWRGEKPAMHDHHGHTH